MCREREEERQVCGTDIDTLTSMQPPTDKGVVERSPRPLIKGPSSKASSPNSDRHEQHRVMNDRDGVRPSLPRKTSSQSPRLLPYFPKPGVTSPPQPQSLARSQDLSSRANGHSPAAPSKVSTRSPSSVPLPSRVATSNPGASPATRGTARNPSPAPASRAGSSSSGASRSTARNPSPAPSVRGNARNPSPTPAPRASARTPSPGPALRSSTRNPSPAPASRASARSASPAPGPSKLQSHTSGGQNSPVLPSTASSRRAASPALVRKDPPRSVSRDNGSTVGTPENVLKTSPVVSTPTLMLPAITTTPKAGTPDVNLSSTRALAKSFKKNILVQSPPESLAPLVKKLSPTELQAQRKERIAGYGRKVGAPKAGRVACEGMLPTSPILVDTRKRCHWVTPQSEAELVTYHDEVWGIPVHDDRLLFELLVLEGAQSELSRPQILGLRNYFREVLGGFDPEVVASFDEKKVTALKLDDILRQPEAKLRGVIENAKQLLKIVKDFGSFDKYLWNFVGFKPIVNAPRIFTQIPVKSSKSEALSKDLMRRGFRYVGPTTVYSFMQAAGMVNDHLATCYRHSECCAVAQMQSMESSE